MKFANKIQFISFDNKSLVKLRFVVFFPGNPEIVDFHLSFRVWQFFTEPPTFNETTCRPLVDLKIINIISQIQFCLGKKNEFPNKPPKKNICSQFQFCQKKKKIDLKISKKNAPPPHVFKKIIFSQF